jgi:hypothetical protein
MKVSDAIADILRREGADAAFAQALGGYGERIEKPTLLELITTKEVEVSKS